MVGLVTQSGAVLVKAAVLSRHKHTDIKLLLRLGHVHEEEAVPVPLVLVILGLNPPVKPAPAVALVAVEDEAAVEADQLPSPHGPPHEQALARPLHCAGPNKYSALLKRVSQVCRETKTVKVWRTVMQGSGSNFSCAGDPYLSIEKVNFLDFALVSSKRNP